MLETSTLYPVNSSRACCIRIRSKRLEPSSEVTSKSTSLAGVIVAALRGSE